MLRVRFAPSPTGYLHIGGARTFIFNWLYARHNGGAMILRIDDTDLERNTEQSLRSIHEGLEWLGLGWDEQYRQSERLALHVQLADTLLANGLAYKDEELVVRFRVPRGETVAFHDSVYGEQSKSTDDIEDFALLRSDCTPTYHLASCADDIDLRISHVVRGQDHLSNTFKHILIFRGAGVEAPQFAHLPLLVAPDGSKLSKRLHGPVVSVTTYRDAGFLPQAFINFLCLLGWNPKDEREQMSLEELTAAFSFESVHRSNAVVNFTEDNPFDPKALWLNAELIRTMPVDELTAALYPFVDDPSKMSAITPLIRERIKLLSDVRSVADFFFATDLADYDTAELIPKKGDAAMALRALVQARETLVTAEFTHDGLESSLRAASEKLGIKAGQMFEPVRVAVCGRKTAPPLFGTLEVLGRETCLTRIDQAIAKLNKSI